LGDTTVIRQTTVAEVIVLDGDEHASMACVIAVCRMPSDRHELYSQSAGSTG